MRRALLPALALLALPGCASIEVGSDWDPSVDFGVLTTWDWSREPRRPTGDPRIDGNTLLDARVRDAVERELPLRGLRRAGAGRPDVVVAYHVALDRTAQVRMLGDGGAYSWSWGPGGAAFAPVPLVPPSPGPAGAAGREVPAMRSAGAPVAAAPAPRPSLRDRDEFTLVLDVREPDTRRLLWRGYARDESALDAAPDERRARIDEMIRRVLRDLPQGGHP